MSVSGFTEVTVWSSETPISRNLRWRLPMAFHGRDLFTGPEVIIPAHAIRMELNLTCIRRDITDILLSECAEEHDGITEVDAVSHAVAALRHRWYVQIYRSMELLQPGVDQTGVCDGIHREYSRCPQSLTGRRKPEFFLGARPIDLKLCRDRNQLFRLKM